MLSYGVRLGVSAFSSVLTPFVPLLGWCVLLTPIVPLLDSLFIPSWMVCPPSRIQWESRHSRRRTHHPRRDTKGVKKGHNGSQDSRGGGHTIQERGAKGVKTLGKPGTSSKKGYKGSQDIREGGHTIQEGIQRESRRGVLTPIVPLLDSLCIPSWMVCPPSRMS